MKRIILNALDEEVSRLQPQVEKLKTDSENLDIELVS